MGNKSNESWQYVIIIVVLALVLVIILPVIGFMYTEIYKERILIESNIKRIEKLKKELEREKEKREE